MLELSAASAEIDSPFVRCPEEEGFQRRLAFLLTVVHRHPKVPTVVSQDLLEMHKEFGNLYYVLSRTYW